MSIRVIASFLCAMASATAWAGELPVSLEARYERAVVQFNDGKVEAALSALEEKVLKEAPEAIPALELKALCLTTLGRDADALKAYSELVRIGSANNKAKYYYEIGKLLYKDKRYAQARVYLNTSLDGGFNVGANHFYLGLIEFADKNYNAAERHFVATIGSRAVELRGLAYFYLGVIYYQNGYPIGAIRGMRAARDAALAWKAAPGPDGPDTKARLASADEILDTSHKILKSLDTARWFGNIAVLGEYDSNVSVLPDSVASPDLTTGKHTFKEVLTGGGGLVTSPVRTFQAVGSYRMYINYNDNPDAKNFDFFTHIPAIYVNYKPFLRLTPGIKIEGNYTFQNLASRDTLIEYHPFSLSGEMGGYGRYEVNPHLILELDGFYEPIDYYQDPPTGDQRRSGDGVKVNAQAEYVSPWKYLAPTGFVTYQWFNAEGADWRYNQWTLGFKNITRFSPINTVTEGFDINWDSYGNATPGRNDIIVNMRLAWIHSLTRHFDMLLDFNYTNDNSTQAALFSYTRVYGGGGITYTF